MIDIQKAVHFKYIQLKLGNIYTLWNCHHNLCHKYIHLLHLVLLYYCYYYQNTWDLPSQKVFKSTIQYCEFCAVQWASLVAQMVKNQPAIQETWVQSLGWENPLEKRMATHSSIFAWRIPWTEEPGGLQSMDSQRAGHNWVTNTHSTHAVQKILELTHLAHPKVMPFD